MSESFEQAKVHIDRGETDQAINKLADHLNGHFHDELALMMLSACFLDKGKSGVSAALAHRAIDIRKARDKSMFSEAMNNLASCYKQENRMSDAEEIWKIALEHETDPLQRTNLLNNLGGRWVNEGNPKLAKRYFDEALAIRSDRLGTQYNRGLANLEMGNWAEGWRDLEVGFKSGDRQVRHYRDIPQWTGEPGQTVIVWGDQGVGDEILFSSCLPDMIRYSKKVIFDCHPRLVSLFQRSFPGVEIHGTRKTLSELDWLEDVEADGSVCLSSLPMYFRNKDADFPGVPFLKAAVSNPDLPGIGRFTAKVLGHTRIGISWAGGTKKTRQDLRSIPLDQWTPILKAVDADFYSLQYTPDAAKEVCELEEATGIRVRHYPGWVQCRDYDRTASFVASMDLVITVATSAHHLANAIGVPTWTLCSAKPSWRYTEKARIFYHTTNRHFQQTKVGDWSGVIGEVAGALNAHFR